MSNSQMDMILREIRTIVAGEIQVLASTITSMVRQLDRVDQRLVDVEHRLIVVENSVAEIKEDTSIIKAVMLEQSSDLDDHEKRIKRLEQAAA